MNDARVKSLKNNLSALLDSLDASVRIERWDASNEAVPEPLIRLASQLGASLGATRELAGTAFKSAGADAAKLAGMRAAAARLTKSYENYEATRVNPQAHLSAAQSLEEEIGKIRQEAEAW